MDGHHQSAPFDTSSSSVIIGLFPSRIHQTANVIGSLVPTANSLSLVWTSPETVQQQPSQLPSVYPDQQTSYQRPPP